MALRLDFTLAAFGIEIALVSVIKRRFIVHEGRILANTACAMARYGGMMAAAGLRIAQNLGQKGWRERENRRFNRGLRG
jgi:hypothetical protein